MSTQQLKGYAQMIVDATGCEPGDAAEIEDYMRNTIFNSTLNWQTAAQLKKAARTAWKDIQFMRSPEGIAYMQQLEDEMMRKYG